MSTRSARFAGGRYSRRSSMRLHSGDPMTAPALTRIKRSYRAVLPALAASGGPLVAISTPYRKTGLLHERHKSFFGVDDPDVLVIQGASQLFNPTLKQAMVDRAVRDDPEAAEAE